MNFSTIRSWNDVSNIVECLDCGLVFVSPLPREDYLRQLYQLEMQGDGPASPYYLTYIRERKERLASLIRKPYAETCGAQLAGEDDISIDFL